MIRKNYYLRYASLFILVLQNATQILLMRCATTREGPKFLKTVAIFYGEILKLALSALIFFISTGSIKRSFSILHYHFITDFLDTLKVGVPALIYTLQNYLLYVAIDHLDATTYMVTYQLKILATALFTVLMLKRRLSIIQWLSLLVLIAGVALVQISAGNFDSKTPNDLTIRSPKNTEHKQQPLIGLLALLAACIMSGFAGIYFEKILKSSNVSLWLRNIQLAVLAIPVSLILIAMKDYDKVTTNGFMQGFDNTVWAVVVLQAFGGLVVAIVVKYADNILKAFATSVAIIVSSFASIVLFSLIPTQLFMVGAALVIGAVMLYSSFPITHEIQLPNIIRLKGQRSVMGSRVAQWI